MRIISQKNLLIDILFSFSIISTITFFLSSKGNDTYKKIARYSYLFITLGLIFLSLFFLYLILSHNFQYTYIWNYSSTQLPLHLLISSFYAGQEGSFLLWALFMAIIGAVLIPYAQKNGYESIAMGFYSLILVFILVLLIIKSPFNHIWDSFDNVAEGFMPPDGRGLNPILENFWITIHPPILFLGYAAFSVPFIFAITGFIKKDYTKHFIHIQMENKDKLAGQFMHLTIYRKQEN